MSHAPSASLAIAGSAVALAIALHFSPCCEKSEISTSEPRPAEPTKVELATTEPAKTEPAKTEPAPAVATVAGMGVVRGVVKVAKPIPAKEADVPVDQQAPCHLQPKYVPAKFLVGAGGALPGAIVRLKKTEVPKSAIPAGWPPKTDHVIDQIGCEYTPRVSVAAVGQQLVFKFSDPTLHNVRAAPPVVPNQGFGQGNTLTATPRGAQRILVECSIHPWMAGAIEVTDHPWCVVTDSEGRFVLPPLPPGTYHVQVWHDQVQDPSLSKDGIEVVVEKDKTTDVAIMTNK
jgi:hypothetical protein